MAKYSTTSANIISNVAKNILGIFHPHHKKDVKKYSILIISSCSQYNILTNLGGNKGWKNPKVNAWLRNFD
jgi:hypothetical protein